jgi:hypothetical protein
MQMPRTLSDEDIDAIAGRTVELLGQRLAAMATPPTPSEPSAAKPSHQPPPKLAYSLKELSEELGVSKASLYRLEARGLLKSLPYLRTKIFSRREVERFLNRSD